ncbi:MAG: hypothetical protein JW840_11045 [Candidatus Thermoplasmatota archaeon]|nr:hypothetical protein [Candidatus Thermoplasmatota archaeon]
MDEHEQISYKTLRRIQQAEQASSLLTRIHLSFYQELSSYIQNLERSIEHEENQLKRKLFTDEIQNTKKIAISIYELREKKIIQAALATARSANIDVTNFVESEKELYDTVVEQIQAARKKILEQPTNQPEKKHSQGSDIAQGKRTPNTNPIVRVFEDTPEFIGTDGRTYSLRKEDVLSLPPQMSEPLVKKQVVKQIK